jgi:Tyrosine phosphatase family
VKAGLDQMTVGKCHIRSEIGQMQSLAIVLLLAGRCVRWGLFYMSGQLLALTENDYKHLAGLGLRFVCDFRIDAERGATLYKSRTDS